MKYISIIAFCFLGIIWGSNFIYMKMASELISSTQIVFFRVLFGFVPVFLYSYFSGVLSWKHVKHLRHFFVMALLATSLYYYAFVKGTSLLLSGVAGALSGAIPLFSFLLSAIFLTDEKITKIKIIGVFIGFIGVAIIGRPSAADLLTSNLEGVFYMMAGSMSVGASFVYAKKFVTPLKLPAAALTTYQLGIGLLILAMVTDYNGIAKIWTNIHTSAGLIVGLGILGTGVAYIIYYFIVDRLGAITASSSTYIPPVVALLIGSLIVGEPIGLTDYAATLLIIIGLLLLKRK